MLGGLLPGAVLAACTGPHPSPIATATQEQTERNRIWFGPHPVYPAEALANHWEGTVVARVVVGPDCRATELAIAQTSGHDCLDQEVLRVADKWTFRGDRIGTNDVKITFTLR